MLTNCIDRHGRWQFTSETAVYALLHLSPSSDLSVDISKPVNLSMLFPFKGFLQIIFIGCCVNCHGQTISVTNWSGSWVICWFYVPPRFRGAYGCTSFHQLSCQYHIEHQICRYCFVRKLQINILLKPAIVDMATERQILIYAVDLPSFARQAFWMLTPLSAFVYFWSLR